MSCLLRDVYVYVYELHISYIRTYHSIHHKSSKKEIIKKNNSNKTNINAHTQPHQVVIHSIPGYSIVSSQVSRQRED